MASEQSSAAVAVSDGVTLVVPPLSTDNKNLAAAADVPAAAVLAAGVSASPASPASPHSPHHHAKPHQAPSPSAVPNGAHHGSHHHHHHHHHHNNNKNNKWKHQSPPPPTNCVVLKNLDYSITQAILEDVVRRVTEGHNDFVSITLIDDKHTGAFRGMAFVNFHTTRDATAALGELSKMVINNRKVIAEYRRLRPGERKEQDKRAKKFDNYNYNHRQTFEKDIEPQVDANGVAVDKRVAFFAKRETVRKDALNKFELKTEKEKLRDAQFRVLLTQYAQGELQNSNDKDIVFDSSLTSYERKMVHHICDSLNLGHISRFDDEGNRVLHVTRNPERAVEWEKEAMEAKSEARKLALEQKRKARDNHMNLDKKKVDANAAPASPEELQGINWFKPRSALNAEGEAANGTSGIRAPTFKTYVPPRKPKGPDGTVGFTTRIALLEKEQAELVVEAEAVTVSGGEDEGDKPDDDDQTNTEVEAENETEAEVDGSCSEKERESETSPTKPGKGVHTVLDPSVPAFSPSYHTSN